MLLDAGAELVDQKLRHLYQVLKRSKRLSVVFVGDDDPIYGAASYRKILDTLIPYAQLQDPGDMVVHGGTLLYTQLHQHLQNGWKRSGRKEASQIAMNCDSRILNHPRRPLRDS